MDDFGFERPELTGAVLSMEFGPGGHIQQIWVVGPPAAEEPDEHAFVLSSLTLDEEVLDDYLPGGILIGARTRPDDPWIVSRNTDARVLGDEEDPTRVRFEYEFSLLPEIQATGEFYERIDAVPYVVWELTIQNKGKVSLEIGELGFPFALNNHYGGFGNTPSGRRAVKRDRLALHVAMNGAASYIHAQRLNAEPPGLIIAPGDDTVWELVAHAPFSLRDASTWPGIPIVYIYSQGTVEREKWPEWFNGHTSLVMEPGESKTFRTMFIPTDSGEADGAMATLAAIDRPTIGLMPGAVVPADVGALLQVAGAKPTQMFSDRPAELEAESDDGRGSCFVKPKKPGPLRVSFEDTLGRTSWAHLLFIEPIEKLIRRRAAWIVQHQVVRKGAFDGAILMASPEGGVPVTDVETFRTPFGIESSLGDALFLAEKNLIYPESAEISALTEYREFVAKRVQNPGTHEVGYLFEDAHAPAAIVSDVRIRWILGKLFETMAAIATNGGDSEKGRSLLHQSTQTLPTHADASESMRNQDVGGSLSQSGHRAADRSGARWYTSWNDGLLTQASFASDVASNGAQLFTHRSLAPNWWSYGSDVFSVTDDHLRNPCALDKGELYLGPSTSENANWVLRTLERNPNDVTTGALRMALGGLLGVWALVRADGAAASNFCPDPASEQFGMSPYTGTVGLSLYHYLKLVTAYCDPFVDFSFGCQMEKEKEWLKVKPWDGVGRRIAVLSYGVTVESQSGVIREFRFRRKRTEAVLNIENPAKEARAVKARIRGLWGSSAKVNGEVVPVVDGWLSVEVSCDAGMTAVADIRMDT
jgi:hypothetical protein